jgi:hypothetical protein
MAGMNFDQITDFDTLKAWVLENAATPEALKAYDEFRHHLVSKIDVGIANSKLDFPLGIETGRTFLQAQDVHCYAS